MVAGRSPTLDSLAGNFRPFQPATAPLSLSRAPAPTLDMNRDIVPYESSSAHETRSQAPGLSQAAVSDVLARLEALPIDHVEATLSRRFRKHHPDCSLLSYLRDPGCGVTQAQAATSVLEELADGIEDVSTATSLVVRYVQAHRLWKDHPNPSINSLEALLGTVDGIQHVQAGTVIGTSSQLMRARAIRLIEKYWGTDWFHEIPADMKDPTWATAADCSHQLLRLIAANAKQGMRLDVARTAWAESIRRRRDERMRKELRMRCPRSPFIITEDVRSLNQIADPEQQGRRTSEMFYPDEPAEDQLRVELVTPRSRPNAPERRETLDHILAQNEKRKRRRYESAAGAPIRDVPDENDGWRMSRDGKWKLKRVNNQMVRIPVSSSSASPSSAVGAMSRDCAPLEAVRPATIERQTCGGLAIAATLREIAKKLAEPTQNMSAAPGMAGSCCEPCRSQASGLSSFADDALRIATALEAVTDHRFIGVTLEGLEHSDSVPPTPDLPRHRRWWLPLADSSDSE